MDYRSAALIMLSALIMWAQHRQGHFVPAQPVSPAFNLRCQACLAAERLTLDRNGGVNAIEDSERQLVSALPASIHPLSVFQQGLATLRRTFDEVKEAALLFGWQVLGDERPLQALLRARLR